MAYIHAKNASGTTLSEGTGLTPLTTATLSATANEVGAWLKVTLFVDTNYTTDGDVTITPTGTTSAKWQLSPAADGTGAVAYGAALTLTAPGITTGTDIWARAKATSDEAPANDISVDLTIAADIVPV